MFSGSTYDELMKKIHQLVTECHERPAVEKALWENERKYRVLTDNLNHGVVVVRDGLIKEANRTFLSMTGSSLHLLLETPISDYCDLGNAAEAKTSLGSKHEKVQNNDLSSITGRLNQPNGKFLQVEVWIKKISYQGKEADLFIFYNASAEKDLDQALVSARQFESIAALSGGIAHDYNNLLAVIMGNLSLAKSIIDKEDKVHHLLEESIAATRVAEQLTKRLISFSKGGIPEKNTTEVSSLVKSAVEFTLSGSITKCDFILPKDLWDVSVDRTQVCQAIHNLVINACEAMPDGGDLLVSATNIYVDSKILQLEPGKYVVIAIKDQGMGIPATIQEKIFDPYFSTKKDADKHGLGLGLSISRSIIVKHGGGIDVSSENENGTIFRIYLPAAKSTDQPKNESKPKTLKQKDLQPVNGTGRVLVMDDEELVRELVNNILSHIGYEAEFAANGEQALEKYTLAESTGNSFKAVILDLTIRGGMGGKETLMRLKKINPKVKCILSSGYSVDPVMIDHQSYGFKGKVAKPYDIYELSQELKRVIDMDS